MSPVLGIDVSKAKLDCALRLPNGKVRSKVVKNAPEGFQTLSAWLAKQGVEELHVCLEATGVYWEAVAEYLADAGYTVSVVNPRQIQAYRQSRLTRTKTDKVDARLIAEFCARQNPQSWQPPPKAVRELKALVARREALVTMRTQELNRLQVAQEAVRPSIQTHLEQLEQAIAKIEEEIRQRIDNDPDLKRQKDLLETIPGLGEKTIATLLAFYQPCAAVRNLNRAAI